MYFTFLFIYSNSGFKNKCDYYCCSFISNIDHIHFNRKFLHDQQSKPKMSHKNASDKFANHKHVHSHLFRIRRRFSRMKKSFLEIITFPFSFHFYIFLSLHILLFLIRCTLPGSSGIFSSLNFLCFGFKLIFSHSDTFECFVLFSLLFFFVSFFDYYFFHNRHRSLSLHNPNFNMFLLKIRSILQKMNQL